jgi:hypothetical protein
MHPAVPCQADEPVVERLQRYHRQALSFVVHEALADLDQLLVEEGKHGVQLLVDVPLLLHQIVEKDRQDFAVTHVDFRIVVKDYLHQGV